MSFTAKIRGYLEQLAPVPIQHPKSAVGRAFLVVDTKFSPYWIDTWIEALKRRIADGEDIRDLRKRLMCTSVMLGNCADEFQIFDFPHVISEGDQLILYWFESDALDRRQVIAVHNLTTRKRWDPDKSVYKFPPAH